MMKTILFSIIGGLLFSSASFAQSSDNEFNTDEITWFGIDYTQCYFLNPIDFPSRVDLKNKLKAWNDLVVYEQEKFIVKTLPGKHVEFETGVVEERNNSIEIKSKITEDGFKSSHLQSDKIQAIINSYNIKDGLTGTGLVLIAESYSKPNEQGAYYVTFFDIETKKVFVTERMVGKAKGFGLRNYWANSYYKVLQEVGKKY